MQTKNLTKIAMMTAVICILSPISIPIPIGPVALTLATFSLYLAAYILTPKQAVVAVSLYLLIGGAGVPVFSGYTAGVAKFSGAGGGYLIGYLFLTAISSIFIHRFPSRWILQVLGMFLGTMVTYTLGTFWMSRVTGATFLATLPMGALIFLPLDMVKIAISCYVGRRVQSRVNQAIA